MPVKPQNSGAGKWFLRFMLAWAAIQAGFFQIGTTRFISSINHWHAANASPRCGAKREGDGLTSVFHRHHCKVVE
jgi:hypothetical protein